jgi:hypothetical protein
MHEILAFFVFVAVMILTAVVFFGWLIVSIIRLVLGGIAAVFSPPRPKASFSHTVRCRQAGCQAINPADARFCRRCGQELPQPQRVVVRRAAVL